MKKEIIENIEKNYDLISDRWEKTGFLRRTEYIINERNSTIFFQMLLDITCIEHDKREKEIDAFNTTIEFSSDNNVITKENENEKEPLIFEKGFKDWTGYIAYPPAMFAIASKYLQIKEDLTLETLYEISISFYKKFYEYYHEFYSVFSNFLYGLEEIAYDAFLYRNALKSVKYV